MRSILFLCVANSARSQMAEGLARNLWKDKVRVQSAGSQASYVHPASIQVLKEIGIDISDHTSKNVYSIDLSDVDTIITLCAEEVCPIVPAKVQRLHWPIQDPARGARNEEQLLEGFRNARDIIKHRLSEFSV